jgi:hypothetical protein
VTFGIDNGRVHLVLLPAKTAEESHGAQSPTFGITFNDVLAWMMHERSLVASGQPQPSAAQPTSAAPAQLQPITPSGANLVPAQPILQPTRAALNPSQPTPAAAATIPTGLDPGALLLPLLCGVVLLILLVAVVRFIRTRRHDNGLV